MATQALLMGGLLVLGGIGAIGWFIFNIYQQHKRLSNGQEVNGTIKSTEMEYDGETYEVDIKYSYQVDGETYESDNVYPTRDVFNSKRSAEKVVDMYSANQQVTVYVMPDDPENAFLRPKWRYSGPLILLVVGMGLILFGVFILNSELGLGLI